MDEIEEIKSRIDVVDVIGKYVDLKRAGRTYKALCPFHQEKTPSFVVFPESQSWRCFGACAEGGDVFTFLMKKHGWDFVETLKTLADQAGVQLRPRTPGQEAQKEAFARLYELLSTAALYYMHLLQRAPGAEVARDYVVERGLLPHTVEQFQLGYALDQWDAAHGYLQGKGYSDEEMLSVGLLTQKEESGHLYDRFRGRLMIPIRDVRGRVVGFGARALVPDALPKYLNSPQTDLFDKSSLLYGLDLAKKGIREAAQAVIVEGYMDVMQGHQAGHTNIVAQMGTALTEAQLKQLKRYTSRLVLALDADVAGQKATLRGLDVARQTLDQEVEVSFDPRGLMRYESRLRADIRVVTLPAGYDPDKLIKQDPEAWSRLLGGARAVVEYVIDSIAAEADLDDAKAKVAAVNRALPIIRDLSNPVERDHYTQYLARRLRVDERSVASLVAQRTRAVRPAARRRAQPAPPDWDAGAPAPPPPDETGESTPLRRPRSTTAPPSEELFCLRQLMVVPTAWRQTDGSLTELGLLPISCQDFSDLQNRALFALLQQVASDGLQAQDVASYLEGVVDETLRSRLGAIRTQREPDPGMPVEKIVGHLAYTILRMRKAAVERAKRELDSAWAEDLAQNHKAGIGEYHRQMLELQARRLKIEKALVMVSNPAAGFHERG